MVFARTSALVACATIATIATILTSSDDVGAASSPAQSFPCPNPKVAPLGKSLGIRGYVSCNDGATGSVTFKGKTYKFSGGVCYKDSTRPLAVEIGATIAKRVVSDMPGLSLLAKAPGNLALADTIDFGVADGGKVVSWNGPVVIASTRALSGTFKDATFEVVNKKATFKASGAILTGAYTCKRVLDVPT